jgi:hypothetical protein
MKTPSAERTISWTWALGLADMVVKLLLMDPWRLSWEKRNLLPLHICVVTGRFSCQSNVGRLIKRDPSVLWVLAVIISEISMFTSPLVFSRVLQG